MSRSISEFQRIYGSVGRVTWVCTLACAGCGIVGRSVNAHTVTGGIGRKADANTIAPLCHKCHTHYDQHKPPFDDPAKREELKEYAKLVDEVWEERKSESRQGA